MLKRIAGGAFIAAATLFSSITPLNLNEENNSTVIIQPGEGQTSHFFENVPADIPSSQIPITLVETIDGDTIKVSVKGKIEIVRYLLIDTPESKKIGMCIQPYANKAFQRNDQLVKSGSLSMELEEGHSRDSYGRLLAYIYVDGISVQESLLKEGFARVAYIINPPYKFLAKYREDEQLAKRNKLNIWSSPGFVTKWGFNGCDR